MAVFSQTSLHMRRFLYRQPRLKTNLSMDFIMGDTVILGICRSLSESGVGGTLSNPVPVGTEGVLTLYFHQYEGAEEQSIRVPAVIEAPFAEEARIRFVTEDPKEREAVKQLMQFLVQPPQH